MRKNKIVFLFLIFILLFSFISFSIATEDFTLEAEELIWDSSEKLHQMNALSVPERDINLKIENLNVGCRVYLYLPVDLLRFNAQKFVGNNDGNDYLIEDWESDDIKELMEKEDYVGYINYLKQFGFSKESNEIELRHYAFCLDSIEFIEEVEYNGNKYVNFKIFPNNNHEFKIVMKDYLATYNANNIIFLIEEYGNYTYIDLSSYGFTTNPYNSDITEMNITVNFESKVDADEIIRVTRISYLILLILLLILILIIILLLRKRKKKKEEELENRKFWKPKLTKEELKQKKKEQKELLKEIKSRKKKK